MQHSLGLLTWVGKKRSWVTFYFIGITTNFLKNVLFLNIYLVKNSDYISINLLSGLQKGLLTFLKSSEGDRGLIFGINKYL